MTVLAADQPFIDWQWILDHLEEIALVVFDEPAALPEGTAVSIRPLKAKSARAGKPRKPKSLAERLGVSQPNVSKLEAAAASPHAGAIYLSTLGGYIAALGGHLEVRAVFPEHPEDDVAVAVGGGWVGEPDAGRRGG